MVKYWNIEVKYWSKILKYWSKILKWITEWLNYWSELLICVHRGIVILRLIGLQCFRSSIFLQIPFPFLSLSLLLSTRQHAGICGLHLLCSCCSNCRWSSKQISPWISPPKVPFLSPTTLTTNQPIVLMNRTHRRDVSKLLHHHPCHLMRKKDGWEICSPWAESLENGTGVWQLGRHSNSLFTNHHRPLIVWLLSIHTNQKLKTIRRKRGLMRSILTFWLDFTVPDLS